MTQYQRTYQPISSLEMPQTSSGQISAMQLNDWMPEWKGLTTAAQKQAAMETVLQDGIDKMVAARHHMRDLRSFRLDNVSDRATAIVEESISSLRKLQVSQLLEAVAASLQAYKDAIEIIEAEVPVPAQSIIQEKLQGEPEHLEALQSRMGALKIVDPEARYAAENALGDLINQLKTFQRQEASQDAKRILQESINQLWDVKVELPNTAEDFHQALDALSVVETHQNRVMYAVSAYTGMFELADEETKAFEESFEEHMKELNEALFAVLGEMQEIPLDVREAFVKESPALQHQYGEYIFPNDERLLTEEAIAKKKAEFEKKKAEFEAKRTIQYTTDDDEHPSAAFQEAYLSYARTGKIPSELKTRVLEGVTRVMQSDAHQIEELGKEKGINGYYEEKFGWPSKVREGWMAGEADLAMSMGINPGELEYSWKELQDIIITAYSNFQPRLGRIVAKAFNDGWINAIHNPNSDARGFMIPGAQVSGNLWTGANPKIYMPFEGTAFDVIALGHELGHMLDEYLRRDGVQTPLPVSDNTGLSEMIAHVGEHLVIHEMWNRVETAGEKNLLLLAYQTREDSMQRGILNDSVAVTYLRDLVTQEGRTHPLTEAELVKAFSANIDPRDKRQLAAIKQKGIANVFEAGYLTQSRPLASEGYAAAATGARAFAYHYFNATDEEKKAIGDQWITVLADTHKFGWDTALESVGIDVHADDFLTKPKQLYVDRITSVEDPSHLAKLQAGRQRQVAGRFV